MGKFCRKCGGDNHAEARFCEHCAAEFLSLTETGLISQPSLENTFVKQHSPPFQVPNAPSKAQAFDAPKQGAIVWALKDRVLLVNTVWGFSAILVTVVE